MKQHIESMLHIALKQLQQAEQLFVIPAFIQVSQTRNKKYGNYATNVALMLAKPTAKSPRDIATCIVKVLPASPYIQKIAVTGEGFINFFLSTAALNNIVMDVLAKKAAYGQSKIGRGKRILVAPLSMPPMQLFGVVVANLLDAIGFKSSKTCYIHDPRYYINQFERGFDLVVNIINENYYKHASGMRACMVQSGIEPERLQYLLLEKPFLYNCHHYIQYAYARICSVFNQLVVRQIKYDEMLAIANLHLLDRPEELQLIHALSCYPEVMMNAALRYKPQLVFSYLCRLARLFHRYYHAAILMAKDKDLCQARLALIAATRQTLLNGFNLLNISPLENM